MARKRRLIYELNSARHCMMKYLDSGCRKALGISVVQLTTLMVLHERNGCLMKDLASALMLDKSALTGLSKRMQEKGLIEKASCEEDSRAVRLMITAHGRKVLAEGKQLLAEVNERMRDGFTDVELDTVSRFLHHLADIFSHEK